MQGLRLPYMSADSSLQHWGASANVRCCSGYNYGSALQIQVALPRKGDRMRTEEEEEEDVMDDDEAADAAEEGASVSATA